MSGMIRYDHSKQTIEKYLSIIKFINKQVWIDEKIRNVLLKHIAHINLTSEMIKFLENDITKEEKFDILFQTAEHLKHCKLC